MHEICILNATVVEQLIETSPKLVYSREYVLTCLRYDHHGLISVLKNKFGLLILGLIKFTFLADA